MNSFIRITIALAILTLVDSTDAKKSLVTSKETRSLCSNSCHNKIPSLCGSDGKTYYGLCELLRARCRSNKTIKIVKFGKCPTCQLNKPVQCLVPACFRPICPAYPKAICVSFCPCQSEYYYQGRKVNCYRNTTTSNQTNPCDLKFCGPSNKCKVVNGKAVCVSRGAVCSLPKVVGPCKAMFLQFYFNSTTQKCEQFYYGGCRGNRNNFKTKELCESACKPDEDPCSLPPVQGPCEARIPRYFHNITSSKCEKFYYGGCGGNKNNFKNIKECEKNCKRAGSPCDLVFCGVNGRCEVVNGRPVCKRAGSPCDLVFCGVNGKCKVVNGKPVCISSGSAVCSLPKVVGPCRARFLRFYFNSKTQKCELFFYGGCRGNGNNFRTRELCENICKPNEDPCSLPPVQGPCKAHIPRYFHNITSSKCEKFYYGGCGGNKNNFINIKECEKNCKRAGSPCDLVFCGVSGKCKVVNGKPVCISSDPCANVSCDAGMKCRVILGKAICRPVLSNPCIATLCRVGTRCVVVNGEGRCIPIKPLVPVNPLCATVLCPQGTKCIVRNKRPICGNPCSSSRQCNQQGSICSLKYGICQCTKYCLAIYRPVCGSDWRRYSNKCHLDAAACRKKTTIRVVPCHGK